tara:strand:+ start:2392 stop:5121 length:2730 start_codon:yes stop_codon:yes gene_type:complete
MAQSKSELLAQIKKTQKEIIALEEKSIALTDKEITKIKEKKKLIVESVKEVKSLNQAKLESLATEEASYKSLNGIYENLGKTQKDTNDMAQSHGQGHIDRVQKVSDINRSIAQLDAGDHHQMIALQTKREELMKGMNFLGSDMVASLKSQNAEADRFGQLTEDETKLLEGQKAVLDGIKNTITGALTTAKTLYGNLTGAVGGLITGMGFVAEKIGKANSELGATMFQTDGVARKAGVLSFFFEDAVGNARALSAELGDTGRATFEAQANIGLISMNMGISGQEAATLTGSFARLNGNSASVATDMIKTSSEFAKQNGIIPAQLMGDLANSAEEFALFGKEGGKNILEAAGYAAKLGVNMKTLSGVADGLLDFETSITKELELGAMLGKNINLNKARELAYNNDIKGAVGETLKQVGGISAFNKMDYYQKKQTADLLGVSVDEFKKMATNQEQAATQGQVLNAKFSAMGELINGGINKYLGTSLKGIGGMVTAAGQFNTGLGAMGTSMGGVLKSSGQLLKNLLGMVAGPVLKGMKAIGSTLAGSAPGKKIGGIKDKLMAGVKDKFSGGGDASPKKGGGMPGKGMMDGMSKINMTAVLKGAAAMVIVAGAVFIFGKAVQEFMKVSWSAVGMAVVSMLALVAAVALLGAIMMSGVGAVAILAGAAAMLIVASAVLVLGLGLQAIGTGFEMLGAGIMSLTPNLLAVGASIMGIASLIPIIGIVSIALFALAGSLAYLSVFGTLALPALMGLGIAFAMAGVGIKMMGEGLSMAIGAMTQAEGSITRLAGLVTPLAQLSLVLFGLSASIMALGVSMAFLGFAGLPGLMMLAGIAAVSQPIMKLASFFGIGDSGEAGAVGEGSLNEYQATMLTKMDQLIKATSSARDIYLDKDKVTNIVMDRGDRAAVNKFSLNRA